MLLLVATVTLAGMGVCPRRAMSCAVVGQASPDCCAHHGTLRKSDCCCRDGNQQSSPALATLDHAGHVGFKQLMSAPVIPQLALGLSQPSSLHSVSFERGLAPPDTPITQHTILLL